MNKTNRKISSDKAVKIIRHGNFSHFLYGVYLSDEYLICGCEGGNLIIFYFPDIMKKTDRKISSDEAVKLIKHPGWVQGVCLSNKYLISSCWDGNLRIFDFPKIMKKTDKEISSDEAVKLIKHLDDVYGVYINNKYVVAGICKKVPVGNNYVENNELRIYLIKYKDRA